MGKPSGLSPQPFSTYRGTIDGYTNKGVNGPVSLETDILSGISLSSGDVILTESQAICGRIEVTTGHASNAIVIPTTLAYIGKIYIVKNSHATLAANIKVAGGSAVTIAATKSAIVQIDSSGAVVRVTADA